MHLWDGPPLVPVFLCGALCATIKKCLFNLRKCSLFSFGGGSLHVLLFQRKCLFALTWKEMLRGFQIDLLTEIENKI